MSRSGCTLLCFLAFSTIPVQSLPVKRVVLYKSGVGYFEHLGRVSNTRDVTVAFTSGQLNDVLKSLTVFDLGGGRVTGVTYPSAAPVERQLGELSFPIGDKATLTDFLGALRGAKVEIRSGTAVAVGRLLSVERKTRMGGGATLEVDYLSMITDAGEVKTIELTPGFSFRLLEKTLTSKLDRYLDLVASAHESDVRKMIISTAGAGDRSMFVSYISEVPVWKATYRVVLEPKGEWLLQGWAIVDNTVGQDWENVELSLVAGAPQSFVQELSKPFYARRPVVPLPEQFAAAPQTHEARLYAGSGRISGRVTDPAGAVIAGASVKALDAAGALVGQTTTDMSGNYTLSSLPDGPTRLEVSTQGFRTAIYPGLAVSGVAPVRQDVQLSVGDVAEAVTVTAEAAQMNASVASTSRSLGSGRAMGLDRSVSGFAKKAAGFGPGTGYGSGGGTYTPPIPAAATRELGDLFEYKLKEPVSIRKNQSALVPIVNSKVNADKVSIWSGTSDLQRPRRALWLTNTSGLTLDGGSFSVIEDGSFAGEGIFESIRPSEKRLVSYAVDLPVTASSAKSSHPEQVTRVRISRGVLMQSRELRETHTYTFRNEDTKPRTMIVEHPVRPGWDLRSDVKPVEISAGAMRFRLALDPKQTYVLKVEEGTPIHNTFTISNITSDQVVTFVSQRAINAEIEEALRRVIAKKTSVQAMKDKQAALEAEKDRIYDDQQRLRENMKSLKGSPEERALLQRYTSQLNGQETRLQELEKEIKAAEAEAEKADEELDELIQGITMDVRL